MTYFLSGTLRFQSIADLWSGSADAKSKFLQSGNSHPSHIYMVVDWSGSGYLFQILKLDWRESR